MEQKHWPDYLDRAYGLGFHLMPPVGWLNDPNGLCQCNGVFHIFFQYSPKNPCGGEKYWGHYETKDFVNYTYTGPFLSPDNALDADGVYSGSAYVEDGEIYIYYTGNVKESGDYDYTYAGRLSNTVLVRTRDGSWTDCKEAVLQNADYPAGLSCHIRDPKVIRDGDGYKMVLGARTAEDVGCVLVYTSRDKVNWTFDGYIRSKEPFGYMWECPDIFELGTRRYLSISPQGVAAQELRYQNIYQSGYYRLLEKSDAIDEGVHFAEWDMGFDFYAPQTFRDASGRTILIGWMGIPDADYTNAPTVEEGWQHALTMARELKVDEQGGITQLPISEYEALRQEALEVREGLLHAPDMAEIIGKCEEGRRVEVSINESLSLCFNPALGVVSLAFDGCKEHLPGAALGYGRGIRRCSLDALNNFRIYLDRSCVEIYINDGAVVFSSRYYCAEDYREIRFSKGITATAYRWNGFGVTLCHGHRT